MQTQDLRWSTYDGHVRVGTLGSDQPFVLPESTQSTARSVDCRRDSIVPMDSDWKVVALDLPLRIFAGARVGILERDHNRARYKLRQATMTTDERAAIGAYVERTNVHLARAPRVRRRDMYKGLDLMQLDCQDMARLLPLDPEADTRSAIGCFTAATRTATANSRARSSITPRASSRSRARAMPVGFVVEMVRRVQSPITTLAIRKC